MIPNQLKLLLDNGYTRNIFKHCDLYTNDDYRQYFYLNSDHYMPVVVNISISQKTNYARFHIDSSKVEFGSLVLIKEFEKFFTKIDNFVKVLNGEVVEQTKLF